MGYRSEVAVAIYGDSTEITKLRNEYDRLYSELLPMEQHDVNWLVSNAECGWEDDSFTLHADGIKWYPDYSYVKFVTKIVGIARDLNLNVEFVEIGEDQDDITTEYTGDDLEWRLSVNRSISFN